MFFPVRQRNYETNIESDLDRYGHSFSILIQQVSKIPLATTILFLYRIALFQGMEGMLHKLKVLLFLTIVMHYVLGESESNSIGYIIVPLPEHGTPRIADCTAIYSAPFVQPVKTVPAPMQALYLGAITGKIAAQQGIWQCEQDYIEHQDIFTNHPISVYKIPLSANTADG